MHYQEGDLVRLVKVGGLTWLRGLMAKVTYDNGYNVWLTVIGKPHGGEKYRFQRCDVSPVSALETLALEAEE